jgi:hypothetical protein
MYTRRSVGWPRARSYPAGGMGCCAIVSTYMGRYRAGRSSRRPICVVELPLLVRSFLGGACVGATPGSHRRIRKLVPLARRGKQSLGGRSNRLPRATWADTWATCRRFDQSQSTSKHEGTANRNDPHSVHLRSHFDRSLATRRRQAR